MNSHLKIRPIKEKDYLFIFEMMNDKEYQKYYLDRLVPKTILESKREVQKYLKNFENKTSYCFIIEENKNKIGLIDIYKIMKKDKRCSIGYGIKKEYWGKNYATTGCKLGLEFIKTKLKLHSIEAVIDPKNIASKKVLTKNGFEKIGVMKDYYFDKEKFVDRELYWKTI